MIEEKIPRHIFEYMARVIISEGREWAMPAFGTDFILLRMTTIYGYSGTVKSITKHLKYMQKKKLVTHRKPTRMKGGGWVIADDEKFNAIKMAEALSQ